MTRRLSDRERRSYEADPAQLLSVKQQREGKPPIPDQVFVNLLKGFPRKVDAEQTEALHSPEEPVQTPIKKEEAPVKKRRVIDIPAQVFTQLLRGFDHAFTETKTEEVKQESAPKPAIDTTKKTP